MKIIQNQQKCIGCGSCVSLCPQLFQMGDDGKAHIKEAEVKKENSEEKTIENSLCGKEAAEACPVQAIEVQE